MHTQINPSATDVPDGPDDLTVEQAASVGANESCENFYGALRDRRERLGLQLDNLRRAAAAVEAEMAGVDGALSYDPAANKPQNPGMAVR